MVLRIPSLFPARRSMRLPGVRLPVLDTNTLREAALRASWRRDQRVARRRLAMRWTLWWLWKYKLPLCAACTVLAGAAYLLHRNGLLHSWRSEPDALAEGGASLQLRLAPQLQDPRAAQPGKRLPDLDALSPVQLKSEIQLKIKESSP